MPKMFLCLTVFLSLFSITSVKAESFYDFKYTDTNKKIVNFKEFKGKTVMVVNIATRCGFTGQLDDLEKMYQNYKKKDFIIVGFPSNDFRSQSPESNEEIAQFCRLKYGATFPIFEKQVVLGKDKTALYKWLTSQKGYENEIGWNFEKFLINKEGKIVARFNSKTEPLSPEMTKSIEAVL
jgi:glutathione peroxidase